MKLEELEIYIPTKKPPSNFNNLEGFENEYFKVISRAPNKKTRVRWNCLCKSCGEYCIKESNNLKRDKSCGCQRKNNIGKALRKDLSNQKFGLLTPLYSTGKSNSSGNAIWHCKCDCGNECDVDSNNLTSNHTLSCGCINKSIGEGIIENILKNNNINYKREYCIPNLYDKDPSNPFRFDFVIFNNNQIEKFIEYDGIQHYKNTWGIWKSNITLEEQQKRDQLKNEWAKEKNIPLVRIPYWERDNITLDMIMGDKYLIK